MQPSAPFVAVPCSEQGKGGPSGGRNSHSSPTHSYHSLRRRDDAPLPLLLGILATETQKRRKEELKK